MAVDRSTIWPYREGRPGDYYYSRYDHPTGVEAEQSLGELEGAPPQRGLGVALDLREVEVRAAAAVQQPPGAVEREQAEVQEAGGNGLARDHHVAVGEVPAARAHEQRRRALAEAVALLGRLDRDRAVDRVDQVLVA